MDPISATENLISNVLDQFHESPSDKDKNLLAAKQIAQQLPLAQTQVQLEQVKTAAVEAQSKSLWVSGARPTILWLCCIYLAWYVFFNMFAKHFGWSDFVIPENPLMATLVISLTGVAYLSRAYEKSQGVA